MFATSCCTLLQFYTIFSFSLPGFTNLRPVGSAGLHELPPGLSCGVFLSYHFDPSFDPSFLTHRHIMNFSPLFFILFILLRFSFATSLLPSPSLSLSRRLLDSQRWKTDKLKLVRWAMFGLMAGAWYTRERFWPFLWTWPPQRQSSILAMCVSYICFSHVQSINLFQAQEYSQFVAILFLQRGFCICIWIQEDIVAKLKDFRRSLPSK